MHVKMKHALFDFWGFTNFKLKKKYQDLSVSIGIKSS